MNSLMNIKLIRSFFLILSGVLLAPYGVAKSPNPSPERKDPKMAVSSGAFLCLSYPEIENWIADGGLVDVSGDYTVWIKAREGSGCRLTIAGTVLPLTHRKGGGRYYSWAKAGVVKLKANKRFTVQLDALQPAFGGISGREIAALALTRNPKADPKRIDEVSLVFPRTMTPPKDRRLWDIRDLNRFYSWPGYKTKKAWEKRAKDLREHCLVSCGLWPEPKKCPLNPQIFERIERDGYSVEKVYFESWPGVFVTGNLYRPLGKKGPFPALACPHGHWAKGRLANNKRGSVPGRCINFARQGYIVFTYDMVGYNDSKQLKPHHFWDPKGQLWGISPMGVQTWNSIRVIDFLMSLKDVDPDRIGCTGASGGGTQTFMLTAVDDRVKGVAPVNMISGHMQGGCDCENAPNLRVDAYNVEIGALAAPRPLIMVCCTGDWTDETPWNEYPAIRSIYHLYGAEDHITSVQIDAGHNYNKASREAVYAWFGKWFLGVNDPTRLKEKPFTVEKDEDLLVFARHPLPNTGINWKTLTQFLIRQDKQQLEKLRPHNRKELAHFREIMEPALRHAIGAEKPAFSDVITQRTGRAKRDDYVIHQMVLGRRGQGDQIPAICYAPKNAPPKHAATILVHPQGKRFFARMSEGTPGELVSALLAEGQTVLAIDPFLCGEYQTPWAKISRDESDKFFTVYNHTDHACRIQDILTAVAYMESYPGVDSVNLVGMGRAGVWCLLARGLAPEVRNLAVEMDDATLGDDEGWMGDLYIPLIRRAGDIETAVALAAPGNLLIYNAAMDTTTTSQLYRNLKAKKKLHVEQDSLSTKDLVTWLVKQ